jgi:hypothetical protein
LVQDNLNEISCAIKENKATLRCGKTEGALKRQAEKGRGGKKIKPRYGIWKDLKKKKKEVETFTLVKRLVGGSKRLHRVDFEACFSEETTSTARY